MCARVAVHDDDVRVVAGREPTGDRVEAERRDGSHRGEREHLLGPEAHRHQVLQPTHVLVVGV